MSDILHSRRRLSLPVEPVLIGVALAVLVLVGWWLLVTPRESGGGDGASAARLATLERRVAELEPLREASAAVAERLRALDAVDARWRALEQRHALDAGAQLAPLEQRLAALERRPAADLAPLERRIAVLEQRQDLAPRVQALEARPQPDLAALERRLAALEARPDHSAQMEGRFAELEAAVAGNLRAAYAELQRHGRAVELLRARLAAGLPLGDALDQAGGNDPALVRFVSQAPPTEAQLRLRFADQSRALRGALVGARADGTRPGFWESAWLTITGLVTVRRGDQVLVGGPADAGLNRIARLIEVGDLAGAVAAAPQLPPAAQAALAHWTEDAQAVLAARAGITRLATGE